MKAKEIHAVLDQATRDFNIHDYPTVKKCYIARIDQECEKERQDILFRPAWFGRMDNGG